MSVKYYHRQTNWLTLIFSVFSLLVSTLIILSIEFDQELLQNLNHYFHISKTEMYLYPILTLIVVCLITAIFSSMIITINKQEIKWHFGPGIWHKTINLADIENLQKVRNKWWYGWGIRRYKSGWLYNVSGLNAIEITLKSGKQFRLGTDEPEKLYKSISKILEKFNRAKGEHIG